MLGGVIHGHRWVSCVRLHVTSGGAHRLKIKIGILPSKVQEHRKRLRKLGLRPIQIWVPDVRSKAFRAVRT